MSGCGLLGGPSAGSAGNDRVLGTSGELEQPSIRLGVLPVVDVASVHLAQSEGYFAEEGLEVELVTVPDDAAGIPSLINGELDVVFGNWVSFYLAQSQGAGELALVSDGYQAQQNMLTVVSDADSPVRSPRDLPGRRVAVTAFDDIIALTARSAMRANRIDPASVTFVELPFPDMIPALVANQVDAAFLVEPFITTAQRDLGATVVLDAASGPTAEIPIAGYGTTKQFAEQNPNTVAAFQRAMTKGQRAANDRANVERILAGYANIPPETAALVNLGTWPTSMDATRLQRVADLMLEFGVLGQPFDVAPLIAAPPAG